MLTSPINRAQKRLRSLLQSIAHYDQLYYRDHTSAISDFEYDCLQAEVQAIYRQFPTLKQTSGPGSDLRNGTASFPHPSPMLSLSNTYSKDELQTFDQNLTRSLGTHSYLMEPKVDGMAINLIYEAGNWVRALTRGDGKRGEDVTCAIRTIPNIPPHLCSINDSNLHWELPSGTVEVRGEVYIRPNDFAALNETQERLGLEAFSNARNLASGSVKLQDLEEIKRRKLQFVAHGIGSCEGNALPTQAEVRQWLQVQHFPVFPDLIQADSLEAIWAYIERFPQIRSHLPYLTDGVVLKVNDRQQQAQLGATAKSPRWAIAYKFEPESAEAQVLQVQFQVGRTGVITPVAQLTPVDLAGSHIARATLHNFDEIKRLELQLGDWVVVQKAGEVIPAIVQVIKERRTQTHPIQRPTHCPECQSLLVQAEGEVALRCPSLTCPAQLRLRLVHFASKGALDIVGLGPGTIHFLVQQKWVQNAVDLFRLKEKRSQWIQTEGFGPATVDPLLQAIEQARSRPLWCWIHALSIPDIGLEAAKQLAEHYSSLTEALESPTDALLQVPLIGPRSIQSIKNFYQNAENRSTVQSLDAIRIPSSPDSNSPKDTIPPNPFRGKCFVLTGTLASMTRSQAQSHIERLGGTLSDRVTQQTSALIVGNQPGSKLQKAQQLGIPTWTEEQFLAALPHDPPNG